MNRHPVARAATLSTATPSRRALLATLGGALALGATGASAMAAAQESATPVGARDEVSLLFVQTFDAGTFIPQADEGFELSLTGHTDQTVWFSDRPDRLAGTLPTEDFVAAAPVFDPANPPNAALVVQTGAGEAVLVVELTAPHYDAATGTLRYDAQPIDNPDAGLAGLAARQQDPELPQEFGSGALFIDNVLDDFWNILDPR